MTSKGSDKILDPEPSLNPESKSTNARKLLVENNSGKVCSGNTSKTLRIGVPLNHGFENFVNVSNLCLYCNGTNICSTPNQQKITGYSIDVFEAAMEKLHDPPDYEYCVFGTSYDELVGNVYLGNLDGAAGDVTITSDRMNITDFTMPYTQSGVAMLVRRDRSEPIQWTFLTPLSKELWFAFVGFFFFTGFVIWMIERPKNPEYQGSVMGQFSTAAYFAFSTLTFSHGQNVKSPLSRSVVVIWCFLVLVLVQSYTASLSSLLTADRLQPSVKDLNQLLKGDEFVGHQDGTFVRSLLIHKNFTKEKLRAYYSADDYANALRKGSKNGGVSAIVDEVPYLKAFFFSDPKYKQEFEIQGQIFRTPGFAFVEPCTGNDEPVTGAQDLQDEAFRTLLGCAGTPPPPANSASAQRRFKIFPDKVKKPRPSPLLLLPVPKSPVADTTYGRFTLPYAPFRSRSIAAQSISHIPASKRDEYLIMKRMGLISGMHHPSVSDVQVYDEIISSESNEEVRLLFAPHTYVGPCKRRGRRRAMRA